MKIFKESKTLTGEQAYYRALGMMILILKEEEGPSEEIKAELRAAFDQFDPEFQEYFRKTSPEFMKALE